VAPQIRRFASRDRTQLIQTIDAVCGEGRWMSTTRFEPTPAWTHALEEPDCVNHLLLVVEDKDRVVGWCRTLPTKCQQDKQEATLGIGLLPAYRDRGIGTALVRQALAWAGGAGYQRIRLTTHPNNARAIHVFRRCGFSLTRRIDVNLLEMTCDLLPSSPGMQGENGRENYH